MSIYCIHSARQGARDSLVLKQSPVPWGSLFKGEIISKRVNGPVRTGLGGVSPEEEEKGRSGMSNGGRVAT